MHKLRHTLINIPKVAFLLLLFFTCKKSYSQGVSEQRYSMILDNQPAHYGWLDSILAHKKIVAFGELDHGDGSTFTVKTDLIKHLHENLGFNTLVFESGMINAFFIQQALTQQSGFYEKVKNNLYNIWSEAAETQPLFDYLLEQQKNGTPLKIVGIDPQFSGADNTAQFIDLLQNTLPKSVTESIAFDDFTTEIKVMSRWLSYPKKKEHRMTAQHYVAYCDTLLNHLSKDTTNRMNPMLWDVFFENLKKMGQIKWEKKSASFEVRDRQMFENTCFQVDQNPDEKFILWAANAHIIRNDQVLTGAGSQFYLVGLEKLGDHLSRKYESDYFSIGITAQSGATLDFLNTKQKHNLDTPSGHSIENLIKTSSPCFINLAMMERQLNLEPYESGMLYTNIRCISKWSRHFDGCILIPVMRPSTPLWKN